MSAQASFNNAPQREQVIASVKQGIANVNDIIDILDHPIAEKGDLIDLDYTPEQVKKFKASATECEHNFEAASVTAQAWFNFVGNELQSVVNTIGQVTSSINQVNQDVSKNQEQIQANVEAIKKLTEGLQHEQELLADAQRKFEQAQRDLDSAKAEQDRVRTARLALCWMPFVALALTVVDLTKEEGDVRSAGSVVQAEQHQTEEERKVLAQHSAQLEQLKKTGLELHAKLTELEAKHSQLDAQKKDLDAQVAYLTPLKLNIDNCIHVVSSALGSASNIDNMMSMKNVGAGIKGLVDSLKDDADFTGPLAQLTDQRIADLDKRIQAMQKTSKRAGKLSV